MHNDQTEKSLVTAESLLSPWFHPWAASTQIFAFIIFLSKTQETTFNEGATAQKAEFLLSYLAQKHNAAATATTPMSGDVGKTGGTFRHEYDSQGQKGDIFQNHLPSCMGTITRPAEKEAISFVNREEYSDLP